MPDPRDDLIRRSEITRLLTEADDRIADPEDRLRVIANTLTMLPADPVAAAAIALAEAVDNEQEFDSAYRGEEQRAEYDRRRAVTDAALDAYRAAIAGRERGR